MTNQGGRRPRKKENPVVEWISDNLRYIMLIAAIAVIAAAVFAAVKFFGGSSNKASRSSSEAVSEVTAESSSESSTSLSQISSETSADETAGLEDADEEISKLITDYYSALNDGDADALSLIVDDLDDETKNDVENHQFANSYSNIKVYSYPGDSDDTYIVFAQYDYTYEGYDTLVPALTQFYVYRDSEGDCRIASSETQSEKADYIGSVIESADVQNLISQTMESYEEALKSDPELSEYIDSLN